MMNLPDTCKGFAYVLLSTTGLLLSSGCGTTGSVTPGSTISQCSRGEGEVLQTTQLAEARVTKTQFQIGTSHVSACAGKIDIPQKERAQVAKTQIESPVEKEKESDSKAREKLDAASRIKEALGRLS